MPAGGKQVIMICKWMVMMPKPLFCKLMVAAKTMYCLLCPFLHSQASRLVQPTADRFGGVSK